LGGGERVIELTALDAPVNDAPAIWRRQLPEDSAIFADMNDEGTRVVFTNGSASELWDMQADRQIGEIAADVRELPTLGKLWFADLHLTQPLLAWIDPQGTLWAWRFPEGEKIRLGEPTQPVHGLVWSAEGDQIATSNPGGVQLWQAAAPALPAAIAWVGASDALAWSAQGLVVGHIQQPEAAVIRDGQIACVLRTGETRLTRFDAFPGTWQALAVSADHKGWLWDIRDGKPLVRFGAGQIILKAGTDGHHFAVGRDNAMMSSFEITHDPVFREFECPRDFPEGAVSSILRVSADGRSLITRTKTALLIWDRKQGVLSGGMAARWRHQTIHRHLAGWSYHLCQSEKRPRTLPPHHRVEGGRSATRRARTRARHGWADRVADRQQWHTLPTRGRPRPVHLGRDGTRSKQGAV